jgi:hypothetical protein
MWNWIIALLTWLSSDPVAIDQEQPRAAAAVAAAYASLAGDSAPPAPAPKDCICGETCKNGVWKPDGRVEQICRCECDRCKKERQRGKVAECQGGRCSK